MLEYVGYVNRGLIHKTNDDAALLNHSVVHEGFFRGFSETDEGIFAVADGVGSISNSEFASRKALNCIEECNSRQSEEIKKSIYQANEEILCLTKKLGLADVLSTTLCVVSVLGENIISYNLGNSRLYRFRDGYLRQLTKDQTKVQELVDSGVLDEQKVKEHPDSHVITRFLGSEQFSETWLVVTEHFEKLYKDDILLLCSDGVHEYVEIDLLEEILSVDAATLEEMAEIIIRCANDTGGYDNATVVLVRKK